MGLMPLDRRFSSFALGKLMYDKNAEVRLQLSAGDGSGADKELGSGALFGLIRSVRLLPERQVIIYSIFMSALE